MLKNEQPGALNVTILFLWLTVAAIAPFDSEGVYYTLIGGNHEVHFGQSYLKKPVRSAMNMHNLIVTRFQN